MNRRKIKSVVELCRVYCRVVESGADPVHGFRSVRTYLSNGFAGMIELELTLSFVWFGREGRSETRTESFSPGRYKHSVRIS